MTNEQTNTLTMKTKEQLEERLKELEILNIQNTRRFEVYGTLTTRVNDWEGFDTELNKSKQIQDELLFIRKILNYLF